MPCGVVLWIVEYVREKNWVGLRREKEMADSKAALEDSAKNVEEEVGRVVEQAKELQDSASSFMSKSSSDEQTLRHSALSLDSSIRRLCSLLRSLLSHNLIDPKLADKAILFLFVSRLCMSHRSIGSDSSWIGFKFYCLGF